jgi:hypothetical protein
MSSDDQGFMFDLERGTVTHDCGYVLNIVDMFDRFNEPTDETEEVTFIAVIWPPDSLYTILDIRDLGEHAYYDERLH